MEFLGNEKARELAGSLLLSQVSPILLQGRTGVGKRTFCEEYLRESGFESDTLESHGAIDRLRSFVATRTNFESKRKYLILDDIGRYSEAAQDSLLKVVEDLLDGYNFAIIDNDTGTVFDTLLSRMRATVRFSGISRDLLKRKFKSDFASHVANGSFSVAQRLVERPDLLVFAEAYVSSDFPKSLFSIQPLKLPTIDQDIDRDCVESILEYGVRKHILDARYKVMSSRYSRVPTINMELHLKTAFL